MSKAIEMQTTKQMPHTSQELLDERLCERIRERAYQLYEARGGEPGHDLDDWIRAEIEMLGPKNVVRAA